MPLAHQRLKRYPFLVLVANKPAGFAFIGGEATQAETEFSIGKFFVLRKFRRQGVGQQFAFHVFDQFRGQWEVREVVQNKVAITFWRKVIDRYTKGGFRELPEPVQHD